MSESSQMAEAQVPPVPAHVPPELVKTYHWHTEPDFDPLDPFAARAKLSAWPEIFFNPALNATMVGIGSWVIRRPDDIRAVLQQAELFTSVGIMSGAMGGALQVLPLEAPPATHPKYRAVLNELFKPGQVKNWAVDIREMAVRLIEAVKAQGHCDFITAFSRPYPVLIFLRLMGMPIEQVDTFLKWEYAFLHNPDPVVRGEAAKNIFGYFVELIADRRAQPRDDLFSKMVQSTVDGRTLTDQEALGIAFNLFVGGLDTVTTTSEWIFKHLAEHPELQAELRADPKRIPVALEELLRLFPVIMTQRTATRDTELRGVQIKQGDVISIPLVLANYDGDEFPSPEQADFNRSGVRHLTFGAGPHTCLGNHLARRELIIAIEEWTQRLPAFTIKPDQRPIAHAGVVGLNDLLLVWGQA